MITHGLEDLCGPRLGVGGWQQGEVLNSKLL